MTQYITSESVTEGHPDKLCDLVSDNLLDAYLTKDPESHVAIECMASKGLIVISGEIATRAKIDVEKIVRDTILNSGYLSEGIGLNGHNCDVIINIQKQSFEIQSAVIHSFKSKEKGGSLGAGDQGMMYGYATNETSTFIPSSIYYAHQLSERLAEVRKKNILPYLRPDGKTQVTLSLDNHGAIEFFKGIVISTQHEKEVNIQQLQKDIFQTVIKPVIPNEYLTAQTAIHINPSGSFVQGGPATDTGLTGRKIIVDTYGGVIPHGGGAFSGKDPTKVDRSAAYMARYVAKQVVGAGLADKCQICVSYAIGVEQPIAIAVETFGTAKINTTIIEKAIEVLFDFSPMGIIRELDLRRPIYRKTACYGHFKASKNDLPWEKLDRINELKPLLKLNS